MCVQVEERDIKGQAEADEVAAEIAQIQHLLQEVDAALQRQCVQTLQLQDSLLADTQPELTGLAH